MNFADKCVIVTGSSNGIGRATAVEFARRGASVLVHGRNVDDIEETVSQCKDVGQSSALFPTVEGDLTDEAVIKSIVTTATDTFGRIDVLVNNAGQAISTKLETGGIEQFDQQYKLLLRTPILLSQLCFPELKKSKGNIVNISSSGSSRPIDIIPFYSIHKAALNMFTQCGALEFGREGVRVNALCPGFVPTSILQKSKFLTTQEARDKFVKTRAKMCPLGKNGTVEETAKLVALIASNDLSMVNGASLAHDGGLTLIGLDKLTMENATK